MLLLYLGSARHVYTEMGWGMDIEILGWIKG
jgi:hypothetical protein